MSLRDQLLKSGVVNKKQAQKAANAARQEKRQKNPADDVALAIQKELDERRERDRQLNREREEQRRLRETANQVREIILTNDCRDRYGDETYFFVLGAVQIRSIRVTDDQRAQLARGQLGVCNAEPEGEDFHIVTREQCERVRAIAPKLVIVLHPTTGTDDETNQT